MTKRREMKEFINFEKIRNELSDAKFYMGLSSYGSVEERNKAAEAEKKIPELEALLAKEPPPPELPPKVPLIKVTGTLEEFSVIKVWGYFTDREYDPEGFARQEKRAQVGALLLAIAGNAAAAAVTSQSRERMSDPSDFVRGKINGIPFHGWLGMTNAKVGDYVELAVAPKDNHYVVYALANPYTRIISMTPRCECGLDGYIKFGTKVNHGLTLFLFLMTLSFMLYGNAEKVTMVVFLSLVFIFILVDVLFYFKGKNLEKKDPKPTILLAERIFIALGFPEPSLVDLNISTKKKLKGLKLQGKYVDPDSDEGKNIPCKWYRLEFFYYY
ncbi:putative type VI secretion system effector [Photorhabdus bodei]|uniref:Uncharacterized protein n=1 Tax=Photorhabdus bodei TaxID=2029681 RepID=A0A329X877_9GAMM|nr:putative type VI secretion system effector [Photorhabdus bodei]RAX11852.1 hypothetical protein CKY02_12740 [Photorhabdus bodei]